MKTLLFFFLGTLFLTAQETLQLAAGESSPKAALSDVAWIQGHWKGEALGGIAEEIWSPPLGGSMVFVFRLVHDDQVSFYEIGHIIESNGSLVMQLKHFDGALRGWETKDETVDFPLVKISPNAVYFEGLTIKRISENEVQFAVLVEDEGKKEEIFFKYQRVRAQP